MINVDVIIVGNGLAGTLLAFELERQKVDFCIVSSKMNLRSSEVAIGVFNPLNFQTYKCLKDVDELLLEMVRQLQNIEEIIGERLLNYLSINKLHREDFTSNQLRDMKRFVSYHGKKYQHDKINSQEHFLALNHSGFIDTTRLFKGSEKYFKSINRILFTDLNYSDIDVTTTRVTWNDIEAKKIVFCEGHHASKNPWFPQNAFSKTKGEVLTIKAPELKLTTILKDRLFIVPIENDIYKVGATFNRNDITGFPSEDGKKQITDQLDELLNCKYEIIDHQAGIRPNIKDRKPVIGMHPNIKTILFFNGLGSRGVLQAPYWAKILADIIINSTNKIPSEVDILRFY